MGTADSVGRFEISLDHDSLVKLRVFREGYFLKDMLVEPSKNIEVHLAPWRSRPDLLFKTSNSPVDSLLYSNGKIKRRTYPQMDETTFYPSGIKQREMVSGHVREWYKNGRLSYQSLLLNNHLRDETEWYENGNIKAQGTMTWGHNKKEKLGSWTKAADWKYWNNNGSIKSGTK